MMRRSRLFRHEPAPKTSARWVEVFVQADFVTFKPSDSALRAATRVARQRLLYRSAGVRLRGVRAFRNGTRVDI
jgi:hypothetical protein